MITTPNPEHLLRRPKKRPHTGANARTIAFAATGSVLVVGAIIGFLIFGHGKTAASTAPATTQVAAVPVAQNITTYGSSFVKHASHKLAAAATPLPGTSPTPVPTSTPNPTPTPAQTHPATAADMAKAKHEAALHLMALRHAQTGAQPKPVGSFTTSLLGGSGSSTVSQQVSPSQPAPTQAPTAAPVAATPDAAPTPMYAPRVVVDARFVDRVTPAYPDIAREQGAQGTAIVLATVGPTGSVIGVQIDQSTGNKLLDQSALSAARSSRFVPPEIDGKPATGVYRIVYTFNPNS